MKDLHNFVKVSAKRVNIETESSGIKLSVIPVKVQGSM